MTKFHLPKPCCYYISFISLISILLSSCSDTEMADLKKYVANIKAKENPHVDAIPEYRHIPPYFYEVQQQRDPFIPLIDTKNGRGITLAKTRQTDAQK